MQKRNVKLMLSERQKQKPNAKRKRKQKQKEKQKLLQRQKRRQTRKNMKTPKINMEVFSVAAMEMEKGKTGTSGNQGDPGGDPNSNVLEGISTGSGKVGGGLGSRGVLASPKVTDNSQKTGRVVVKVCVDSTGKVISAKFTQGGSTTTDSRLRAVAEKNALRWKFSKGTMDKQCGTITYDFKVQ